MIRVLVFNFFGGVKERGIPIYARGLAECMRRIGAETVELECPRFMRTWPSFYLNLAFVFFEQFVTPILRITRGCSVTFYPYNSAGVIDAWLNRSVCGIHDLIPNSRKSTGLAAFYIRSTQWIHCRLRRPISVASAHTLSSLRRIPKFLQCRLMLWHNPFYDFEREAERVIAGDNRKAVSKTKIVLLFSGIGANKDFRTAIKLITGCESIESLQIRIIGFGGESHLAVRYLDHLSENVRRHFVVLGLLDLRELLLEYFNADVVWMHSLKEGFGRPVMEGRICGRPVIASNIAAFRQLAWMGVRLYNAKSFEQSLRSALEFAESSRAERVSAERYHQELEASVAEFLAGKARS